MGSHDATKAVFFGLEGLELTAQEKDFFAAQRPLGFILFARNIASRDQVKALTASLKSIAGQEKTLILIDQEGGRVARLKPPHWRKAPPAGVLASLSGQSRQQAEQAVYLNARMIAAELYELGITVNCAPMADIQAPGSHDIIGDRAFGQSPEQVTALSRAMAQGLLDGGVLPVLKHIPGHGRAKVDSHESLPIVDAPLDELRATDFVPFKALADIPLGMTAHILYTAIDKDEVATLSKKAIGLIRTELHYDGLLMSDDLSMKALKGDMGTLTRKTIDAGCDVVLHCNGKMEEMSPIAEACPLLSEAAKKRVTHALNLLNPPKSFDLAAADATLSELLAKVA